MSLVPTTDMNVLSGQNVSSGAEQLRTYSPSGWSGHSFSREGYPGSVSHRNRQPLFPSAVSSVSDFSYSRSLIPPSWEKYRAVPGGRDFAIHKILGYSECMEFYSPAYDTPERVNNPRPDNRTTLYWNPYVQTDTTGNGFVEFYTDDREDAELEITIEGITSNGSICHTRQKIK